MADYYSRPEWVRWLLSKVGSPGHEQQQKLEILEHARRILEQGDPELPGWWQEIRTDVTEGRL